MIENLLSVVASLLSIIAAVVSIISARKAARIAKNIKEQNNAIDGITFQGNQAVGNKGDGFSVGKNF
ncbi:MAG: hypothetical protein WD000_00355 [Thermodesulfobacteriota bacterium]